MLDAALLPVVILRAGSTLDSRLRRFYAGQTIFALWNAVNDPLFGWMSDTASGRTGASRRLRNIALGGPLWAVAFALVWVPWSTSEVSPLLSGLHFAVSLCLYDGALTFVEVNHSALLSDMTHDGATRAKANAASGVGAAIGALSSYLSQLAWASGSFGNFQAVCMAVAVLAAAVIAWSVRNLQAFLAATDEPHSAKPTAEEHKASTLEASPRTVGAEDGPMAAQKTPPAAALHRSARFAGARGSIEQDATKAKRTAVTPFTALPSALQRVLAPLSPSFRKYVQFVRQLTRHRSFLVFVVVSTIQVFDCTFEKNFFGMFLEVLTAPVGTEKGAPVEATPGFEGLPPGPALEHNANAAILTLSFILPHVATVLLAPLTQRIGVAAMLDRIFGARVIVLCVAWVMGPSSALLSGSTVLLNRVMSECVCRAFPLVTADIVDEDTVRNGRKDSLGASVIGTAALVSKLSQSIAPVIGYSLMASISPTGAGAYSVVSRADQLFVWDVLVYLPAVCVLLQLAAWRSYPLRAEYMAQVKDKLVSRDLSVGQCTSAGTAVARSPKPVREVVSGLV